MPLADDSDPPRTFDEESPISPPARPFPTPLSPNRRMPVTMRPIESPEGPIPQTQPQTIQPQYLQPQLRLRPDGRWEWVLAPAPKANL